MSWPVMALAASMVNVGVAALAFRFVPKLHKGTTWRLGAFLAGAASGIWLAWQESLWIVQWLDLIQEAAGVVAGLAFLVLAPFTAGTLGWMLGEIIGGASRQPILGAVGACVGCAVVVTCNVFAGYEVSFIRLGPPATQIVGALVFTVIAAIGYEVLRGGSARGGVEHAR